MLVWLFQPWQLPAIHYAMMSAAHLHRQRLLDGCMQPEGGPGSDICERLCRNARRFRRLGACDALALRLIAIFALAAAAIAVAACAGQQSHFGETVGAGMASGRTPYCKLLCALTSARRHCAALCSRVEWQRPSGVTIFAALCAVYLHPFLYAPLSPAAPPSRCALFSL